MRKSDDVRTPSKKFSKVNPFVEKIIINYYEKPTPDIDINAVFKKFCRELAKCIDRPVKTTDEDGRERRTYSAVINNEKVRYTTTGFISQQFWCIGNRQVESTNVINRNKLFVFALHRWLKKSSVNLEILEDADENLSFKILHSKIFDSQESINTTEQISNLLSSYKAASSFIFCCSVSDSYAEISLNARDSRLLSLSEIKSNIHGDVIWNPIFRQYDNLNFSVIGGFAVKILTEAVKQPVFHLLLDKWAFYKTAYENNKSKIEQLTFSKDNNRIPESGTESEKFLKYAAGYHKTFLILLRNSFKPNKTSLYSAISSLDRYIMKSLIETCSKTEYTLKDTLDFYGKLADSVIDRATGELRQRSISEIEISKELKADVLSNKKEHQRFIREAEPNTGKYKFVVKPYRLFFKAVADAAEVNLKERVFFYALFENIYSLAGTSCNPEDTDLVNLSDGYFEDVIVYSSILIRYLDTNKRNGFIDFLIKKAQNCEVEERNLQILSIYILTIMLSENSQFLNYEQRKSIFLNTYGKTAYKLELLQFDNLTETSLFFKKEIIRTFNSNFDYENLTSDFQPYYFFWYDIVFLSESEITPKFRSPEIRNFCKSAFESRKKFWSRDNLKADVNSVLDLVEKGISLKKNLDIRHNQAETRMFAYAINALLYTIANILNYDKIHKRKMQQALEYKLAENTDFLDIVFFSDFTVRKSNNVYMNHYHAGKSDFDLYLLCGAFRLFCALGHCNDEKRYRLNEEMKSQYESFLKEEYGRYFYLLSYMLSFTDFFDGRIKFLDNTVPFMSADFLPYDNLDIKNIKKHPTDVIKWRK